MDYKEKYEQAKRLYESANDDQKYILENLFPELAENEDEKIRKELIAMFSIGAEVNAKTGGIPDKDIVAWLEKRGDTPKKVTCTREVEVGNGNIKALVTVEIPIDKVESKFKVGDWIIGNRSGSIFKITQYEDRYGFELTDITGCVVYFSPDYVESNYRLWTIKDAKDGDVLISSIYKQPFVYNGNYTCDSLGGYFGLNYQGELLIGDSHNNHVNNWTMLTGVQPATEEQCNMLFEKLHDSNYKWDSKKKELWHKWL